MDSLSVACIAMLFSLFFTHCAPLFFAQPWLLSLSVDISFSFEKVFTTLSIQVSGALHCWAVQRSWFARVNALCNLLCKKSRKVVSATSRLISE